MVGNDFEDEVKQERLVRKQRYDRKAKGKVAREEIPQLDVDNAPEEKWIERVRINSENIRNVLSRVSHEYFPSSVNTFPRPFRPLIFYQEKMKEELKQLEERWAMEEAEQAVKAERKERQDSAVHVDLQQLEASDEPKPSPETGDVGDLPNGTPDHDEPGASPPSPPATGEEDAFIGSVEALREMRVYCNFIDEKIMPLMEQFTDMSKTKIRFDDLWYLFKLGDLIHVPGSAGESDYDQGKSPLSSKYQKIWKLYGMSIDYKKDVQQQLDTTVQYPRFDQDDLHIKGLVISCYFIEYTGHTYDAVYWHFEIPYFEGESKITSLAVFPFRYLENCNQLLADLKEQGERFQSYIAQKHLSYSGPTITYNSKSKDPDKPSPATRHTEFIDSDIIIDTAEALTYEPQWEIKDIGVILLSTDAKRIIMDSLTIIRWKNANASRGDVDIDYETTEFVHIKDEVDFNISKEYIHDKDSFIVAKREKVQDLDLDDEHIVLLPGRMFAYILRERKFSQIDIRFIRPVSRPIEGFDSLKLPKGYKQMVQALVNAHFMKKKVEKLHQGANVDYDIVQGKGRGLVILLHGVPGVGKTSTAECVAQANNKPLFAITCGDLGFTPAKVDQSLTEIFRFAHLWNCVLLLDEADVFLSQRSKFDLKRNALVTVFLRVLEYYNGILFLTTNRVGVLDEAFKSRIHMSLYYPPLSKGQTLAIWAMNLERTKKIDDQRVKTTGEKSLEIYDQEIREYAESHFNFNANGSGRWNGRQIRNAFQIASSLARYEVPEESETLPQLRRRHFEIVADATLQFDKYMIETAGKTDSELAFEHGDRADHIKRVDSRMPIAGYREEHVAPGYGSYGVGGSQAHNQMYGGYTAQASHGYGLRPGPATNPELSPGLKTVPFGPGKEQGAAWQQTFAQQSAEAHGAGIPFTSQVQESPQSFAAGPSQYFQDGYTRQQMESPSFRHQRPEREMTGGPPPYRGPTQMQGPGPSRMGGQPQPGPHRAEQPDDFE